MNEEILYSIALTRVLPFNSAIQNILLNQLGSAKAVFEHRHELKELLPESSDRLIHSLTRMDEHLLRAEQEMKFAEKGHITSLLRSDENYPARLRECDDAPILLYYRGNTDLNAHHIVSIVGTRHCTEYGKTFCRHFIEDLAKLLPDTLVVSGLAYGIDINAHRQALEHGLNTVGVLAHGLDQIYPRLHRETAVRMLSQGGLLTEFMSESTAEKVNFVSRNRIVAGMADAVVVVESKAKGGGLITASIAMDYSHDVFAVPGRIGDEYSEGCNQLIRDNKANLLQNAEEFVTLMGWGTSNHQKKSIQREIFPQLSPEENLIYKALKDSEGKHINQLTVETNLPVGKLSSLLFALEMRGVVRPLSGGTYRLA